MNRTDILKYLRDISLVILSFFIIYILYTMYLDRKRVKELQLHNSVFKTQIDSLNWQIKKNSKHIDLLKKAILLNKDSVKQYEHNILLIKKFYDVKYNEINNFNNTDIVNEFTNIFSINNIK